MRAGRHGHGKRQQIHSDRMSSVGGAMLCVDAASVTVCFQDLTIRRIVRSREQAHILITDAAVRLSFPLPTLGVSSLDLGRSLVERPFFMSSGMPSGIERLPGPATLQGSARTEGADRPTAATGRNGGSTGFVMRTRDITSSPAIPEPQHCNFCSCRLCAAPLNVALRQRSALPIATCPPWAFPP